MGLFSKTVITTTETSRAAWEISLRAERDKLLRELIEAKRQTAHNATLYIEEREKFKNAQQRLDAADALIKTSELTIAGLRVQVQTLMSNETTLQVMETRRAADATITSMRLTQIGELTHERDHLRADLDNARGYNESLAAQVDQLCNDFRGKLSSVEQLLDFARYDIVFRSAYTSGDVHAAISVRTPDGFRATVRDVAGEMQKGHIQHWSIEAKGKT